MKNSDLTNYKNFVDKINDAIKERKDTISFTISFYDPFITYRALEYLYQRCLYITNNTPENLDFITNILFVSMGITSQDITVLIELLKLLPNIKSINLGKNNIDDNGVKLLLNALKDNHSIEELNLYNNIRITDDSMEYLAALLETNDSINTINFNNCNITEHGVTFLLEGLRVNTSITAINVIDFYDNFIGIDNSQLGSHVNEINQIIRENQKLNSLFNQFSQNKNVTEFIQKIQKLLEECSNPERVNAIKEKILKMFPNATEIHQALEEFQYIPISQEENSIEEENSECREEENSEYREEENSECREEEETLSINMELMQEDEPAREIPLSPRPRNELSELEIYDLLEEEETLSVNMELMQEDEPAREIPLSPRSSSVIIMMNSPEHHTINEENIEEWSFESTSSPPGNGTNCNQVLTQTIE